MPTSKSFLLDINCWLAAAARRHVYHPDAKAWIDHASGTLAFCRVTQMGFLRLATNPKVMKEDVLTLPQAWEAYQKFLADPRIVFADEAEGLENFWKEFTGAPTGNPNMWTDAYLAAFAKAGGHTLVTFDQGFSRFANLSVKVLYPAALAR